MPTTHDLLKARFNMVRQDFEKTLARISEADLTWSPRDGMRTIRGLLLEIADKEREALKWIQTGTWPDEDPPTFDEETATLADIKAAISSLRANTISYLDSLSEQDLERLIDCPEGWWEALRLRQCPVHEVLRNIAAHEWYHTAQLITYLWSRGDNPDDWA